MCNARLVVRHFRSILVLCLTAGYLAAGPCRIFGANGVDAGERNLLLNPSFAFHSFDGSRTGVAGTFRSGSVACWNTETYGDIEVVRSTRTTALRTQYPTDGVVRLRPGKKLSQFALLCELELDHGDCVSLSVRGRQEKPAALQATIHSLRLDNQMGTFSNPPDARVFPKHSRGELVRGPSATVAADRAGDLHIKLENVEIVGSFTESADASDDKPNTIGVLVEFENRSDADVWLYAPCLTRGSIARERLPVFRDAPEIYRGIPRTIQKLWRGEPLHLIVMGSSIDRGSANPRMALYDEDPASPTFKQVLSAGGDFDGAKVGHPEWNDYIAWWQHHFMYGGRLRRMLMQKFDYPIDKLLLNTMACDGSSVGESHSGLLDYAELKLPPSPALNGHREGKSWRELYPTIFSRPEGLRPDLVIFGSGANEHIDGADEVAVFEGAIRWFQRRYPEVEFVFCMWQNREGYSPNPPHLAELSLRYQIPVIDLGRKLSLTTRHCNSYALCPKDGHPQAAGHFLWAKQLETAFDVVGPISPGAAQRRLPQRISPYTVSWEGDTTTYDAESRRIKGHRAVVLDDTMINLWAKAKGKDDLVGIAIDGVVAQGSRRRPSVRRDVRNSTFAAGRLSLGDRHIAEVSGTDAELIAVDMKTALNRRWLGVESSFWGVPRDASGRADSANGVTSETIRFESAWGAPYGTRQRILAAGQAVEIDVPATDLSIAWVDDPQGGVLSAVVDGAEMLKVRTNQPFKHADGEVTFMENRRGIVGLPYGKHRVLITAEEGPVRLLGLFAYDTRANHDHERVVRGYATPGERISFSSPFRARPLTFVTGGLQIDGRALQTDSVLFEGTGPGSYEIIGE